MDISNNELGKMLKSQRLMMDKTLSELAMVTAVSPSYLARIEQGDRFPSAKVLRRLAEPLGFTEVELFMVAGYLPSKLSATRQSTTLNSVGNIDAYVASALALESVTTQRALIGILSVLKAIAREPTMQTSDHVRNSNLLDSL